MLERRLHESQATAPRSQQRFREKFNQMISRPSLCNLCVLCVLCGDFRPHIQSTTEPQRLHRETGTTYLRASYLEIFFCRGCDHLFGSSFFTASMRPSIRFCQSVRSACSKTSKAASASLSLPINRRITPYSTCRLPFLGSA